MLAYSSDRNEKVNGKISNMMISQYMKGLKIKEGDDDNVNVIKPMNAKQKRISRNQNNPNIHNKLNIGKSKDTLKEFLSQSNILDSELNQMVSQLKLNNKEEFYGGAVDKHGIEYSDSDDDHDYDPDDKDYDRYVKMHMNTTTNIYKITNKMDIKTLQEFMKENYNVTITNAASFKEYLDDTYPILGFESTDKQQEKSIDTFLDLYSSLYLINSKPGKIMNRRRSNVKGQLGKINDLSGRE